ncbi:hypothetical protein [Lichenicoccus roseus]|uniref:Uncharacterized protein n=1 Tax=Lichenicoccus roseus TaxID=2683649 RepID=A0A5R9J773_9PROT|nr:hypothetical protein [Lichenicoccus roseus]TLU71206.1 hypothetical protein FE263_18745 [Lichenicoccus roseus]
MRIPASVPLRVKGRVDQRLGGWAVLLALTLVRKVAYLTDAVFCHRPQVVQEQPDCRTKRSFYRNSLYTVSGEIGSERFWTASRDDQVLAMGHVPRTGKSSALRAAVREAQAAIDRFLDAEEPAPYIGSNKPKTPCGGSAVPAPE